MTGLATTFTAAAAARRVKQVDWSAVSDELDSHGYAVVKQVLTSDDCDALIASYADESLFRTRVVMSKHGFGRGEYKYFAAPLPALVSELRSSLYPPLARVANQWNERLGIEVAYPGDLASFLERCHAAGQTRPTPLLLRYVEGDYNCLHQDLYGQHVFPLQVAFLLASPGSEFTGGEFVLTEQRPRMQSRVEVVPLGRGDGVVFAVNRRPVKGARGDYRVTLRHGVSRLRSGRRHTLGIIFHDAE